MRRGAATACLGLLAAAALAAGCGGAPESQSLPGASANRGHDLIEHYGCGSCHKIGGVSLANGHVGPDLRDFKGKRFIAGRLPNTPKEVARWIQHPQQILPNTIMPGLGVTPSEARDIAAYLYTQ